MIHQIERLPGDHSHSSKLNTMEVKWHLMQTQYLTLPLSDINATSLLLRKVRHRTHKLPEFDLIHGIRYPDCKSEF